MTDTIRKQILDKCQSTLEAIKVASGYNFTVAKVSRNTANPLNEGQFPLIQINEQRELYEAGPSATPANTLARRLGLLIECWLSEPHKPAEEVAQFLGDVEKALLADHTLGGLSVDVILVSNEWVASEERTPVAGALLEVEIFYRTPFNDPNTSI